MKRLLILLHGLPGAGKSTLAKGVSDKLPDLYYADVTTHPGFRKRPMSALYTSLYDVHGSGQSLIIEGVLANAAYRDTLISSLMDHVQSSAPFDSATIIRIEVELEVLASRRNRSLADYAKMAAKVQTGSAKFDYHTFEPVVTGERTPSQSIEHLASVIEELRHS